MLDGDGICGASPVTGTIRTEGEDDVPLETIKKTRPLDDKVPRINNGSWPRTRFNTVEAALCCWNRVTSPAVVLNDCQLMIAPGVFVTVNVLPED